MTETTISGFMIIFSLFTILAFVQLRGKVLLMFFQQEEYETDRFLNWIGENKAFDLRTSIGITLALIIRFFAPDGLFVLATIVLLVMALSFALGARVSQVILNEAKKPLVMTMRAKRIHLIYWAVMIVFISIPVYFMEAGLPSVILVLALITQAPPLAIVIANKALSPFEKAVKAKFRREAELKIETLRPKIIALSGSYGKTSTKHILAHILGAATPTLFTPGSVNTEMGVTRIIRENLEPKHKYFVVETGAYQKGSIANLCTLTPPDVGVITSIGMAHYERFKSVETVLEAKFELAEAVQRKQGPVIINCDGIPADLLKTRLDQDTEQGVKGYILAGREGSSFDLDLTMTRAVETAEGLEMDLTYKGDSFTLKAPIYGLMQAENIMVAAGAALALGYPPSTIKAALTSLPQTKHRLEVFKNANAPTVIDDAYNSNPVGFAAALHTLDILSQETGGRRILITPGMVELGEAHDERHRELGTLAGTKTDITVLVTPDRIPTFIEGFNKTAPEGNPNGTALMSFATQGEAEVWFKANSKPTDVVLWENNLPDLFEATVRF